MDKNLENTFKYDSDMPSAELDKITLNSSERKKGLIRLIIFSLIGIFVFFCSIPHNGESEIVFSIIYNGLVDLFGDIIYWILTIIIGGNLCCHIYFKYIKKGQINNSLADVYKNDNFIHTILYALGFVYVLAYAMYATMGTNMPEFIVGDATGGNVIPPIVKGVLGIILIGAIFMPFLLNYGILEIIGVILEPIMRPLFKVPGKAALDAVSSFVSSSSLGVLITNRLWKKCVYTEKEMCAIMTGFSAVSIGFAYLVINTAGVGSQWVKIYAISFIMVFILETIMVRIPLGASRAIKRGAIARGIVTDIKISLKDSVLVLPQVLTMLSAIGVSAMILAEYTPLFTYLGYIFQPLLVLFRVPDAAAIAPSMPVGIAEMFLPVLVMNGQNVAICTEARIFVCLVSMVQIIFFSETATVMLATKSPIKF